MTPRSRARISLVVVVTALFALTAAAQLVAPKPGTDTKFLTPLVGKHAKAGKKFPPMMPPVESKGTMVCAWTAGELFVACDIDEKISGGPIDRFQGHLVVGWDFSSKKYRGHLVSSAGMIVSFEGKRELEKLVLTSGPVSTPMGNTTIKWTIDMTDKAAIGFKDERSLNGATPFVFEDTVMK